MTTPRPTELQKTYNPKPYQVERIAALTRFNWFYVYTPIIVVSLVVLTLVILLFIGAFSPGLTGAREFASALADIILILVMMPMMVMCAIVPLTAVGFYVYRRQQPKSEYGRLQILLWRLDSLVDTARAKTREISPKVAQPVIRLNAQFTYLEAIWKHLRSIFTRR